MIGDRAFAGCGNLENANVISENGAYEVHELGNGCFSGCSSLTAVYLKMESVSTARYGLSAFAGCTGIKKAVWLKNPYIGQRMFDGCTSLTSV